MPTSGSCLFSLFFFSYFLIKYSLSCSELLIYHLLLPKSKVPQGFSISPSFSKIFYVYNRKQKNQIFTSLIKINSNFSFMGFFELDFAFAAKRHLLVITCLYAQSQVRSEVLLEVLSSSCLRNSSNFIGFVSRIW